MKVGSNVLTRADGTPDITIMSSIVDQIVNLREKGYEVILVTSGAVACGRRLLKRTVKMNEVEQRQLFSAMGQVRLINTYFNLFRDHGVMMGQILTMKSNFAPGEEYVNQKSCMEVMLRNKVIPVVNENDTVCVTELMFTDNDELSGLVSGMMNAGTLVILSNIDGIYDGDPTSPDSRIVGSFGPDDDVERFIGETKSSLGRGGMASKCATAKAVAASGTKVIIANGRTDNILVDVVEDPSKVLCTVFSK